MNRKNTWIVSQLLEFEFNEIIISSDNEQWFFFSCWSEWNKKSKEKGWKKNELNKKRILISNRMKYEKLWINEMKDF